MSTLMVSLGSLPEPVPKVQIASKWGLVYHTIAKKRYNTEKNQVSATNQSSQVLKYIIQITKYIQITLNSLPLGL